MPKEAEDVFDKVNRKNALKRNALIAEELEKIAPAIVSISLFLHEEKGLLYTKEIEEVIKGIVIKLNKCLERLERNEVYAHAEQIKNMLEGGKNGN